MKFRIVVCAAVLALCACSKNNPPATVEEKALMNGFANYVGGLTYDEVCNKKDPKSRYDFDKAENVLLMGNQQLYAARLGGLMHIRAPEKPVEDIVQQLVKIQDNIEAKARDVLAKQGCDSQPAQAMAKAYTLYSTTQPAMLNAGIDKAIIEQGGKITSPDEVNNAGKPVKK